MSQQIKPSAKKTVIKRKDFFIKKNHKRVKTKCMEKIRKSFHRWGFHGKKYNWYGNIKKKYYKDEISSRCYNYLNMRLY